jgi:gamma-glutamyltranspeptidase/glutathione hydrolase
LNSCSKAADGKPTSSLRRPAIFLLIISLTGLVEVHTVRAAYIGSVSVASPNAAIQSAGTDILGNGGGTGSFIYKGGGNAVDAAVAAGLAACVVTPGACSLGGYGGHMMIWKSGWDGEPQMVTCIDFNTAAGSLASSNMFVGSVNPTNGAWTGPSPPAHLRGWKAAGVPGTFAGLYMAQTNYGRKISGTNYFPFADILKPALARIANGQATGNAYYTLSTVSNLLMDLYTNSPGYLDNNGNGLNNPYALFYSGRIALDIAAAMQTYGGLVTYADMTNYRPREVTPYMRHFNYPNGTPALVCVAPLGSAGLSVLQELAMMEALGWTNGPDGTWDNLEYWHSRAEVARLMWKDHYQWLGDPWAGVSPPDFLGNGSTSFPDQMLAHATNGYAYGCPSDPQEFRLTNSLASSVIEAVNNRTNIPIQVHWDDTTYGTCHISTSDQWGNCVSMTLTMGGGFGAQVAVTNRGLVLGQSMAKFDPRPGWPDSIAPGKRPVNNMCPAIVIPDYPRSATNGLAGGRPPLAIGGVGGSTIPNNMAMQLLKYLMEAPSSGVTSSGNWLYNFEGNKIINMRPSYPAGVQSYLTSVGFTAPGAPASAGSLAYVQAWIPPIILTQPASTNVPNNGTANFEVTASGLPLFYQWFENGVPLSDGTNVAGARTPRLTVASAMNGRSYSVVITNGAGSVTSAPVALGTHWFLYEPFNYTNIGGPVSSNTPANWTYGGSGANDLNVTSGNLSYSGLAASIGNSVTNGGPGLGVRRLFGTNFSSGKIYFSALFRISDLGFGAWSGQSSIAGALTANDNTSFRLQVLVKSNSPSGYVIGTQKSGTGATATFDTTERHAGDTILLVGKYEFAVTPNRVTLWINPSTFGTNSEPASGGISATTGADGFSIDRFNIRQNAATGSFSVPAAMQWDELRFGISWADVTPLAPPPAIVRLTHFTISNNGTFQFAYSNSNNEPYTVFASTNLIHWSSIGTATETSPGRFEFTDLNSTNIPHRFYQLRWP